MVHNISTNKKYNLLDDASQTVRISRSIKAEHIIVDGYKFVTEYQKSLKDSDLKVTCIDDIAKTHFVCDFVVNQNLNAEEIYDYSCESYTKLLLGTGYCMLRREFLEFTGYKRIIRKDVKNILISIGGADPNNITLKILQSLKYFKNNSLDIHVVLGDLFRHKGEINNFIEKKGHHKYKIYNNISNMSVLIKQVDLALVAAGSVVWELALLQTPMMVGISASNQENIALALDHEKIACNIGWFSKLDLIEIYNSISDLINNFKIREIFSKNSGGIIDGKGAIKIMNEILRDP